ncbi:hypothetical protein DQ393_22035 [Rhizobium tropici]|jgi:hypothetical protein|uniref:Uncharacterized protein n=1 Tax=Rhizobium tropici TaxID=398 RepID=A0A329Y7I0_RHITR|nr:hypothetical protein DQ393_22035 [Rhizobium tropici]
MTEATGGISDGPFAIAQLALAQLHPFSKVEELFGTGTGFGGRCTKQRFCGFSGGVACHFVLE